jgi:hypothetical protein
LPSFIVIFNAPLQTSLPNSDFSAGHSLAQ